MTFKNTINQRFSPEWDSEDTSALDPRLVQDHDEDRDPETGAALGILGGTLVGAVAGGPVGAVVGAVCGGIAAGLGVAAVETVERLEHNTETGSLAFDNSGSVTNGDEQSPDTRTVFALAGYDSALAVMLAGTFNDWTPSCHFLELVDGQWVTRIGLPGGKYEYKFVVDDEWILDPGNPNTTVDSAGNCNSVVVVPDHPDNPE